MFKTKIICQSVLTRLSYPSVITSHCRQNCLSWRRNKKHCEHR